MEVDELTGVGARAWFDRELRSACRDADPIAAPVSLLWIDIDRFAAFAAQVERTAAEYEMVRVARALSSVARDGDALGRVGDDEFALLLPNTDAAQAAEIAERCRVAVYAGLSLPHGSTITVSIGFATGWRKIESSDLIEAARAALDEAKAGGRNIVAMYRPVPEN
jgi:diguanylate cyclase (GGDEF)-like protein